MALLDNVVSHVFVDFDGVLVSALHNYILGVDRLEEVVSAPHVFEAMASELSKVCPGYRQVEEGFVFTAVQTGLKSDKIHLLVVV